MAIPVQIPPSLGNVPYVTRLQCLSFITILSKRSLWFMLLLSLYYHYLYICLSVQLDCKFSRVEVIVYVFCTPYSLPCQLDIVACI